MSHPLTHLSSTPDPACEGTVYYRQRGILLLAPSLQINLDDRTHRRTAVRLLLAQRPFVLTFADGHTLQTRAVLLSPQVDRYELQAPDTDFALFDFAVASPEYVALLPLLENRTLVELEPSVFAPLLPRLKSGQDGSLASAEVSALAGKVVQILTGVHTPPLNFDARVMVALQLIEQLPLVDIKLPRLAQAVNLSPDRFRHLFRASTGCTVSHYARSTAVWRALMLMASDRSITDASHAAGFHDVSHFYKAYADLFGTNLAEKRNIRKFRRVRCF